ncbi:gliding motility-associated C-terminal domain-containing protein [Bacteroidota bacterium]
MSRIKVFVYLVLFLIANNAISQVDTVTIRFIPDAATFKLRCQAEKVNIVGTDTTYEAFSLADTVNGAYVFDWSGTQEPNSEDGLPLVSYEFGATGVYTFNLSVYEDATGITYTDSKDFEIRDIIRVPNVFTPNGDGVNDLFVVRANGVVPLEISIYSRTGTLVYNNRSPIIVWDGRNSSGSELSQGIYYYVLKSDDPAVPTQNGFFHLYIK